MGQLLPFASVAPRSALGVREHRKGAGLTACATNMGTPPSRFLQHTGIATQPKTHTQPPNH
jgi:hypothetical protein